MAAATYTHRHAVRSGTDALLFAHSRPSRGQVDRGFQAALTAGRRRAEKAATPVIATPPAVVGRAVMNDGRLATIPARRATELARLHADARPTEILTIAEAAALLGLAESTVRRYRFRAGTRPARLVKVGRGVSLASVEAMLNAR